MEVTPEMLHKIAHLARLEIGIEEQEEFAQSLGQVLGWMDQLTEVDTEGVEPLTHMTTEINVWREDVAHNDLPREEALSLAPSATNPYVRVPKVIE